MSKFHRRWYSSLTEFVAPLGGRRLRPIAFGLAFGLFVGGIWISLRAQPDLIGELVLRPFLMLVGIAIPASVLLHTLEFRLLGRLLGQKISLSDGARVVTLGAAANTLPLPGALAVRVVALRRGGAGLRAAGGATILLSFIWLGLSLVYAGSWLRDVNLLASATFISGGTIVGTAAALGLRRIGGDGRTTALLVLTKCFLVLVDSGRLYLCLCALGGMPSVRQASVLGASTALGAVALIAPAGLGFQEFAAAALSPLVDVGPSLGFLAATVNRFGNLLVLLPLAGLFAWAGPARRGEAMFPREAMAKEELRAEGPTQGDH